MWDRFQLPRHVGSRTPSSEGAKQLLYKKAIEGLKSGLQSQYLCELE